MLRDLQLAVDAPDHDVVRAGVASEASRHAPGRRLGDVCGALSDQSQYHGDDLPVLAHRARGLHLAPKTRRQHWWLIGLVPIVAGILGSKHATSKIAFAGAAIVFATFQFAPTAARRM